MRGIKRRDQSPPANGNADKSGIFEKYYPALDVKDRWIGSTINDRYQIVQKLGDGGYGSVYLSADKKKGDLVAVKLLGNMSIKESATGNGLIEMSDYFRFVRESRTSKMVDNPNIVKVLDSGIFEGTPFLVMEYLKGTDLRTEIKKHNGLSWERVREVTLQICDGLIALHNNGMIHRDIKPSNIFLAQEKGKEVIKLIDFGLVKFTKDLKKTNLTDSNSDEIVGTPAYMAPEMLDSSVICDHRLDIYSLGATIYEMLVGQPPFNARNYLELMLMHRDSLPRPISETHPEVPRELEQIVSKALQKRPEDRYQTVDELKAAINSFPENVDSVRHERKSFMGTVVDVIRGLLPFRYGDFLKSLKFTSEDLMMDLNKNGRGR